MLLKDKRIIVFGTNSDISKTITSRILKEEPSYLLTFSDSLENWEAIERGYDDSFEKLIFDYSSELNFESLANLNVQGLGFDGIVFAAGIGGVRPAKLNSQSFVQQMFQVNVFSFFEIIRFFSKKRWLNQGASIVVLSSVSSIKGLKSKSVYSSSKAALDAAVRGFAAELSDKKIRVNSIQKGWVTSDMQLSFIKDNMALNKGSDFDKQLLGAIEPKEIANLVTFLLSDQVTTLTGTSITLDGGYSL